MRKLDPCYSSSATPVPLDWITIILIVKAFSDFPHEISTPLKLPAIQYYSSQPCRLNSLFPRGERENEQIP